ncbi:hypothetical protein [Desulfonatronovibrio hydrogenovorans]|uniref:hypothetical protein n=1 Tax=Desulfonatronovibrio hydrogenovorans TaxID=53245 RepID=UPI00049057C0|nr:hypothetical protein [Desulfonatronovibrio hydrogenovorans]
MPEFTRKRARQHTRARLGKIKKSLEQCAYYWDDLDLTVMGEIERIHGDVEDLYELMDDSCDEEDGLI